MSHTYATLEVSAAIYDEIATKLRDAGYGHVFDKPSKGAHPPIDMHGLVLVRGEAQPSEAVSLAVRVVSIKQLMGELRVTTADDTFVPETIQAGDVMQLTKAGS